MNKKMKSVVFLAVSLAVLFRIASFGQERGLPMIFPGVGIGEIKLGEEADTINSNWNEKADDISRIKIKDENEYLLLYRDRGLLFVCNKDVKLKRMICISSALLVKGSGLRVGSTRKEMERSLSRFQPKYNELTIYNGEREQIQKIKSATYMIAVYSDLGIAFTLMDNKITSITVFTPGEEISGIVSVGPSWSELLIVSRPISY
jgi:hypothetical protein